MLNMFTCMLYTLSTAYNASCAGCSTPALAHRQLLAGGSSVQHGVQLPAMMLLEHSVLEAVAHATDAFGC